LFGVVNHALEIHHDDRLVAYNPSIVPRRKQGNIPGLALKLTPVIHDNFKGSRNVVLVMGRFATLRIRKGFNRCGPLPSRFKHSSANHGSANFDEINFPLWKVSSFFRLIETFDFSFFRDGFHIDRPPYNSSSIPKNFIGTVTTS
jgi:hypothetical protein